MNPRIRNAAMKMGVVGVEVNGFSRAPTGAFRGFGRSPRFRFASPWATILAPSGGRPAETTSGRLMRLIASRGRRAAATSGRLIWLTAFLVAVQVIHLPGAVAQSVAAENNWRQLLREGRALAGQQKFLEAEDTLVKALKSAERFGTDDPRVAACLNALALLYQTRGNSEAAEPLFNKALGILQGRLKATDPAIAKAYFNLGEFYRTEGRLEEAEEAFDRLLIIVEANEGTDFIPAINQLALAYFIDRHYGPAEKLLRKSAQLSQERFGSEDPRTARVLSDLGVVYLAAEKAAPAAESLRRALEIREKIEGSEADLAVTLGHLAKAYAARLHYAAAEQVFLHSIAMHEKAKSPNRREFATVTNNLGEHYRQQGELEQAEQHLQNARGLWEELIGAEHAETATTLFNLASLYQDMGRPADARPFLDQCVAVFEKTLGSEHPKTVLAKTMLADNATARDAAKSSDE